MIMVWAAGPTSSDAMLRIRCPCCGERDYTEFSYGGDATRVRPAHGTADRQTWYAYVFLFDNPKGRHQEFWQHVHGCRQWLVLERNTATNEAGASRRACEGASE
jgi:heterotetrameric sarcosine oxidase delta subunit